MANLDNAKEIGFGVVSQNNISTHAPSPITSSATEPTNPNAGDMWYDTSENIIKHYDGSRWIQMSNKFSAVGGTEGTYTDNGTLYKYHVYTSSGVFNAYSSGTVDVLLVAAGGGTGWDVGGGGGAGGLIQSIGLSISPGNHSISIGAGGSSGQGTNIRGTNGGNTTAFSLTAIGGGGGGAYNSNGNGLSGGSGGGAGNYGSTGGSGTAGQGYAGGSSGASGTWATGGGGGAGGAGANHNYPNFVAGGAPLYLNYNGSSVAYAGGGYGGPDGGAVYATGNDYNNSTVGFYGFGANGTGSPNGSPYSGNAGIVIIRYPI
jgi:hypothetical protein